MRNGLFGSLTRRSPMVGVACLLLASAVGWSSVVADTTTKGEPVGGRFTMHQADGGYLRLDTMSGQMSMCARKDGRWQCEALGDERAALQKDIDQLAQENRDLKGAVKRLEEMVGLGDPSGPEKRADKGPGPKMQLPTEEDVDKALNYAQRMLKKFRDKIKELSEDGKGTSL